MNGVHDMGGMDGFGRVAREANEPVFHAEWEGRVFALASLVLGRAGINVDGFRHAIERIPPARYLASSYYERWMLALETLLVERGLVERGELIARLRLQPEDVAAGSERRVAATEPSPSRGSSPRPPSPATKRARGRPARFREGDEVRARNLNPAGHTRLPRYVRGRTGAVRRDWGVFTYPDTNAHHAGENPQHVYCVEFPARELWGKPARARERVFIDLWEDYLEPAESRKDRSARSTRKPGR